MHGKHSLSGAALSVDHERPTDANPAAGATETTDHATRLMAEIHDTIGRLASLEHSLNESADDEGRHAIAVEMDRLAAPLRDAVGRLTIETGGEVAAPEGMRWDSGLRDWMPAAAEPEEDTDAPDPLDVGPVTLERSPARWCVYLIDTEPNGAGTGPGPVAELAGEHARRSEAMAWLRSWARRPDGIAAVAVGPGDGRVTMESLELFDDSWQVYRTSPHRRAAAELVTFCDRREAKRMARRELRKGACPVIITPCGTEPKGGAR